MKSHHGFLTQRYRRMYLLILAAMLSFATGSHIAYSQRYGCDHFASKEGPYDSTMPEYHLGVGLASMDVNKDGHLDVLCSAFGPKTVFVFYGGPALFDTTADLRLYGSGELAIADFNGDGLDDLAVRLVSYRDSVHIWHPDSVLIYMGVEDSKYAIDTIPDYVYTYPVLSEGDGSGYMGRDLFEGNDLDGDGKAELLVGSMANKPWDYSGISGVSVWHYPSGRDNDSVVYIPTSDALHYTNIESMQTGDVNGDGIGDIVLGVIDSDSLASFHPPRVRVAFGAANRYPDPSHPDQFFENDIMKYTGRGLQSFRITLLDANADGIDDLLWVRSPDSLLIMFGGPNGLSGTVDRIIVNPDTNRWGTFTWRHHRIGDHNGDGYDDYVIGLSVGMFPALVLFAGSETGLWNEPKAVCVAGGHYGGRYVVNAGDLDGDGDEEYCTSDPIPPNPSEITYQPGYLAYVRGQTWMTLGVEAEQESSASLVGSFSIDVYPVPSTETLSMDLHLTEAGEYILSVYTLGGRLLYRRSSDLTPEHSSIQLRRQELDSDVGPALLLMDIEHDGMHVQKKILWD